MNRPVVAWLAAVTALVAVGAFVFSRPSPSGDSDGIDAAEDVMAPVETVTTRASHPAASVPASPSEQLRQRLLTDASFKDVHDELMAHDAARLKPHEQFVLAFILERCRFAETIPASETLAFARNSTVQEGDPERVRGAKQRIAKRGFGTMCAGIPRTDGVEDLIDSLHELAAAGGDPRAQAWLLQRELEAAGTPQPTLGFDMPGAPDEAQRQRLLDILGSGDPMAIGFAGPLLTRGYDSFGVAVGPDRITPSIALQNVMWDLLACDFGANCGPTRLELAFACASAHRCDAANYYDYLQRHVLTPQDLQDFARMRPYLEAGLRGGDWSGIHFLDHTPGNYTGSGTRRFGLGG